jgi:hypothetical protein
LLPDTNGANGAAMRPLWQCIFACLGFALLFAGADPVRSQEVGRIAPKLHWCEAHKDSFDIVFVGSSRVFHGLSPRIFDRVASASGQRWRSFNLGMDKMGMAQSMAIIRELVATGPRHLKYVFFELEPGTATLAGGQNRSAENKTPSQPSGNGLGPDGDGFFPMNKPMSPALESFYQERLAAAKANPAPRPPNEVVRAELGRFYEEMAARNIQVIFVVAPSLRAAHGSGVNAPPGSPLFSFDDLVRYASLYDEKNRMDAEHLNARGAEIFSRTLAQEFIAKAGSTAH